MSRTHPPARPRPGRRPPGPSARPQGGRARSSRSPSSHTTVSVERATLRLAGLAGADHERHAVGQPPRRRRPRRGRPRARRHDPGLGRPAPRRGARPRDAGPEGRQRATCRSGCPSGREATRGAPGGAKRRRGRHRARSTVPRATRERLVKRHGDPQAEAVDLPHRRDRRHLRGHPAGAGRGPRGRRRHRRHPLDRAVAARLRARGRHPRGLRRHLRHAGELPADAGRARRRRARSSAATSG